MLDMKLFLQGVAVLLMLWTAWHSWTTARNAAQQIQVNTMAQSISDVTTRVTRLEERIRHLPEDDLVHELAGDMKALKAEMEGVRSALGPLATQVGLLNQYLLTHK